MKLDSSQIGSIIDDDLVPSVDTEALDVLLSNISNRLKGITGKSDWKTSPEISIDGIIAGLTDTDSIDFNYDATFKLITASVKDGWLSTNTIRNQNASAQTANFWISGSGKASSFTSTADSYFNSVRIGQGFTSGNNNVVLGYNVGTNITSSDVIAIGRGAMGNGVGGFSNIGIGLNALYSASGEYNIAIGGLAMQQTTTGTRNLAFGYQSLFNNTTGSSNIAIGYFSLNVNTTGGDNIAIGANNTLTANTIGGANIALGSAALASNISGSLNMALGTSALSGNTTGTGNVAIGPYALRLNTTGDSNVGIGQYAGWNNATGMRNVSIGEGAGYNNTGASTNYNTFIGYHSGYTNSGSGNVALGYNSGFQLSGSQNLYLGYYSGDGASSGNYNVVIGTYNLPSSSQSNSLAISDGNGNLKIYSPASHRIILGGTTDNGVDQLQVSGSGYFSTGVNSTQAKLSSALPILTFEESDNSNLQYSIYLQAGLLAINGQSVGDLLIFNKASNTITSNSRIISTIATGTAPFTVASTTLVANLNADLFDGQHSSYYQAALSGTGLVKSSAGTISYITDNSANWNTAYGWGNHSGLYYLINETTAVTDADTVAPGFKSTSSSFTGSPIAGTNGQNQGYLHTFNWFNANNYKLQFHYQVNQGLEIRVRRYNSDSTPVWQSWNRLWHDGNDGASSGLDADLLDGQHGSYYATASSLGSYLPLAGGTLTGQLTMNANIVLQANRTITFGTSGTAVTGIDMGNNNIINVNNITFNDSGPNEGFDWAGGNLWKVFESPNDITTNSAGNLQIVQGTTRRATFNTSGQIEIPVTTGTAPLLITSTTLVSNLNVDYLDGQHGSYYAAASSLANYLPLVGGTLTGGLIGTTASFSSTLNASSGIGAGASSGMAYGLLSSFNSTHGGTANLLALGTADGTYNPRVIVSMIAAVGVPSILRFSSAYSSGWGYTNYEFNLGLFTITRTSEQLRVAYDSTNYTSFTTAATGYLTISPSGTKAVLIQGVARFANVGAPTTTNISVGGSGTDYGSFGYNVGYGTTNDTYTYITSDFASWVQFQAGGFRFRTAASGTASATISYSTPMTLTQAGILLIGATSASGSAVLQVTGSQTLSGTFTQTNASGGNTLILQGAGTNHILQKFSNTGGNAYVGIASSTGVGILGGATTAYSFGVVTESARNLILGTNNTARVTIDGTTGVATLSSDAIIQGSASIGISGSSATAKNFAILGYYSSNNYAQIILNSPGASYNAIGHTTTGAFAIGTASSASAGTLMSNVWLSISQTGLVTMSLGDLRLGGNLSRIGGDASGNLDFGYNIGGTPNLRWYGGSTTSVFTITSTGIGTLASNLFLGGYLKQNTLNTDLRISANGTGFLSLNYDGGSGGVRVSDGGGSNVIFSVTTTDGIFANPINTSSSAGTAFLINASGYIKSRTASQVLSDIGAAAVSGGSGYIQNRTISGTSQTATFDIQGDSRIDGKVYIGANGAYFEQVLIGGNYRIQAVDSNGNKYVI